MGLVNFFTVLYVVAAMAAYIIFVQHSRIKNANDTKQKINWFCLGSITLVGFLVRYILTKMDPGYDVDMGCFGGWSDAAYNNGLSNFYNTDMFSDYPPGYIYVLWVIGALRHSSASLAASSTLVKMPAIIADLIATGFVYKLAHKKFNENGAVVLALLYSFNPVILIDSAMWGQVDSVFTLFALWTIYLVSEKKLVPAYFVFAVGVLIKPQTLILTPILGFGILEHVFFKDFSWKKFLLNLGSGLAAIFSMYLVILPFRFDQFWLKYVNETVSQGKSTFLPVEGSIAAAGTGFFTAAVQQLLGVIGLYTRTMSSYEQATVNAYNFWGMFGLNWHSQEETAFGLQYATWGTIFIILIVASSLVIFLLNKNNKDVTKYFFLGAFIAIGFFTLSVRIHERYMFPAFVLLLCAYLYKPRKELMFAFLGFTLTQTNNIWHAFKFYDPSNFDWEATFPKVNGFFHMVCFAYIIYIAIRMFVVERNVVEETVGETVPTYNTKVERDHLETLKKFFPARSTEQPEKFTKFDWIAIVLITCLYGAVALFNLGDMDAPQTYQEIKDYGATIDLDFSNAQAYPSKIDYYDGRCECRNLEVMESTDNVNWNYVSVDGKDLSTGEEASKFEMNSVFCWGSASINITAPYVRLVNVSTSGEHDATVINELVFSDMNGNVVRPANADAYPELFDETDKLPEVSTFRDSTYFDEIYHGRTGYEMTRNLYNYEWTHPPLGKFFISLGIRIFGMCPFGWRIAGTLFGIAMLPFFYLFSRRIFRNTWIAAITTTLFASDFMHFTQTRIATIDVYVTFFVICMYYFMYKYSRMNFFDEKLTKTFIPLLCSGIAMGFGCASKWTGVYAGAGLGIIFFGIMLKRYFEYRQAWNDPKGKSGNIENSQIVMNFKRNILLTIGFCVIAFVIIPGTIFTLSYIPFEDGVKYGLVVYTPDKLQPTQETSYTVPFEDGTTATVTSSTDGVIIKHIEDVNSKLGKKQIKRNTGALNHLVGQMVRNQFAMWNYHSQLNDTHPFSSHWYEWIIMKRPIWYYNTTISGTVQGNISAFGNPLVWWAGIPAFFYLLYRIMRRVDTKALFLVVAYLAQLLPWVPVTRCTFIYHYFPSVPFVTLMVGYSMYCTYEFVGEHSSKKQGKLSAQNKVLIAFGIYTLVAIAMFIWFYPVLSGYPMETSYGKALRWFKSWVLYSGS